MQGFALASLATLLLVTCAAADSRSTDARRAHTPIVIQGFSYGADSTWNQTIAPEDPATSRERREGAFRFDGNGWNYWQGDGQKCWGKRQYPQCT